MAVLALEFGAGQETELLAAEDTGAGAVTDCVSPHVVKPLHQPSAQNNSANNVIRLSKVVLLPFRFHLD